MTTRPSPSTAAPADFATFYDATCRAAYSLALRVAGSEASAGGACESAYAEAWAARSANASAQALESALLTAVRKHALRARTDREWAARSSDSASVAYTEAKTIRTRLEMVDPLGRRAVELAYFGGMPVDEIAALLDEDAATVRAAMRSALLDLGHETSKGSAE